MHCAGITCGTWTWCIFSKRNINAVFSSILLRHYRRSKSLPNLFRYICIAFLIWYMYIYLRDHHLRIWANADDLGILWNGYILQKMHHTLLCYLLHWQDGIWKSLGCVGCNCHCITQISMIWSSKILYFLLCWQLFL